MSSLYPDLPLTSFPESLDTFITYLNITSTDAPYVKQYFTAMQNGDIVTAQSAFNQIPQGSQKMITAEGLNKLSQAITALQRFYKTDVQSAIDNAKTDLEKQTSSFKYNGIWSATKQYEVNNYVVSPDNNFIYICHTRPPVGAGVLNTDYWRVLTIQGIAGQVGEGLSFTGTWNGTQSYSKSNVVSYNDNLWVALQNNSGQTPYNGSTYWEQIATSSPVVYPVSAERPNIQEDGALWMQII